MLHGDRRRARVGATAAAIALALALGACGASPHAAQTRPPPPHSPRRAPGARGASRSLTIRVSPTAGGPRTVFTITYITRIAIGRRGRLDRSEALGAQAARARAGCRSSAMAIAPVARAGARVRLRIRPAGLWCPGPWRGRIVAFARRVCPPGRSCPQLILNLGVQGSFSFRVRAGRR